MRIELVDERDATWELHGAPFRLFVYRGSGSAVTAYDLVDASLNDAVEAAHNLSRGDELIWSLAVVVRGLESAGESTSGLVWISGMDYHDQPMTPHEWARRSEMQKRYLARRSQTGEAPLLPDGRRLIRMFPEWVSGLPLWESFTDEYHLDGSTLGLDAGLERDLVEWNDRFGARGLDDPLPEGWVDEGWALAGRLQEALADRAEVSPEFGHYPSGQ